MSEREYKSTVFTMLLEEPENALQIYNGLNGTDYTDLSLIETAVLDSAILLSVRNDAAFIVGNDINLYEHQSTYNPNMAIRQLIYYSHILEGTVEKRDLYARKRITIPNPHFVVFYNGVDKRPAYEVQKLSDSFAKSEVTPELELICGVYNINPGYNDDLLSKCPALFGYTEYVERVRKGKQAGKNDKDAVNNAIDSCINDGILSDFFRRRRNEVTNSTMIDMTWEVREKLIREEEREEGREEGLEEGRAEGREEGRAEGLTVKLLELIIKKVIKGKALEDISEELEEDIEKIKPLYDAVIKQAPDYNINEILNDLTNKE